MSTTRESILSGIYDILSTNLSVKVLRNRAMQINASDVPLVIILPLNESSTEYVLGRVKHNLAIGIIVYAKGDATEKDADDTIYSVLENIPLGSNLGLSNDITVLPENNIVWSYEEDDYIKIIIKFTVQYITEVGEI